jgi:hypothetical protein
MARFSLASAMNLQEMPGGAPDFLFMETARGDESEPYLCDRRSLNTSCQSWHRAFGGANPALGHQDTKMAPASGLGRAL